VAAPDGEAARFGLAACIVATVVAAPLGCMGSKGLASG
jgi:hypothetical protein